MSSEPVKVCSHHEVLAWVREQTAKSVFKPCAHLHVKQDSRLVGYGHNQAVQQIFIPDCERRSFEWNGGQEQYGVEYQESKMLSSFLHDHLICCPTNCLNYQNRRWALQRRRLFKLWEGLQRWTTTQYRRFAGLPATTQALIIVLLIVIFARPLIPLIVMLLKPLFGH